MTALELDNDRFAAWIGACLSTASDDLLTNALAVYERKAWRWSTPCLPILYPLTDYQHSVLRVHLIAAIEARGGHFDIGGERWKAEGDRLWKTLPW